MRTRRSKDGGEGKRVLTRRSSRSIEREARNDSITQFAIWLLLTIAGVAVLLGAQYVGTSDEAIHRYIDSALLSFSLSALMYVLYRVTTFDQIARLLNYSIHEIRDDVAEISVWERKKRRLKRIEQSMIVEAGSELMSDYLNMLDVSDTSLKLKDTKWSLHFNGIFWRYLTSYSRKVGNGVVVLVTHTTDVRTWQGETAEASLDQQARFIQSGQNKIFRMFLHRTAKPRTAIPERYREVMRRMEEKYGIQTSYLSVPTSNESSSMPDATLVTKLGIFMTWTGVGADEFQIGSMPSELNNFKEQWPKFFSRSIRLDGSHPQLPEEIATELQARG